LKAPYKLHKSLSLSFYDFFRPSARERFDPSSTAATFKAGCERHQVPCSERSRTHPCAVHFEWLSGDMLVDRYAGLRALRPIGSALLRPGRVLRCLTSGNGGRAAGEAGSKPTSGPIHPEEGAAAASDGAAESKRPQHSRWRALFRPGRLLGFVALGSAATVLTFWVVDPEGTVARLERLRHELESRIRYYVEPSREKLLPDPVAPFPGSLPPRTLVLDLDETLVHSDWTRSTGWRTSKRPGVDAFLAYIAQFYEIVVFTSALPGYADPILDRMDPNGYITHRLYRHETKYRDGLHMKDLAKLNRDLRRTIIIDNDPRVFALQSENGIEIAPWNGTDPDDKELLRLTAFLEWVVRNDVADVRPIIATVRNCDRTTSRSFAERFEACRQQVESVLASQKLAAVAGAATASSSSADGHLSGNGVRAPVRGLGIFAIPRRDPAEQSATTTSEASSPAAPAQPVPDQSIWTRLRR